MKIEVTGYAANTGDFGSSYATLTEAMANKS
jgi:hypothetical protein